MGNQIYTDSNGTDCGTSTRNDRATLQNIAGTWFVDNQKIVIEMNLAVVFTRGEKENWEYAESLEVKDEQLHFQFKDHILSKGRLRASSDELMFRNGEDVRLWTRQDPFTESCKPFQSLSCDELVLDCLALRHPSDLLANGNKFDAEYCSGGILPGDSFDEREARLPVPGDSAAVCDSEVVDGLLPELDFLPAGSSIETDDLTGMKDNMSVMMPGNGLVDMEGAESLMLTDCFSETYCDSEYSDISSSELLCEPSWLDDEFFTKI